MGASAAQTDRIRAGNSTRRLPKQQNASAEIHGAKPERLDGSGSPIEDQLISQSQSDGPKDSKQAGQLATLDQCQRETVYVDSDEQEQARHD